MVVLLYKVSYGFAWDNKEIRSFVETAKVDKHIVETWGMEILGFLAQDPVIPPALTALHLNPHVLRDTGVGDENVNSSGVSEGDRRNISALAEFRCDEVLTGNACGNTTDFDAFSFHLFILTKRQIHCR